MPLESSLAAAFLPALTGPAYERGTGPLLPPSSKSLEERAAEVGFCTLGPTDRTAMLNAACR